MPDLSLWTVKPMTVAGALIYRVIPPRNEGHKLALKSGHAAVMIITFVILQLSSFPSSLQNYVPWFFTSIRYRQWTGLSKKTQKSQQ